MDRQEQHFELWAHVWGKLKITLELNVLKIAHAGGGIGDPLVFVYFNFLRQCLRPLGYSASLTGIHLGQVASLTCCAP